MMIMNMVEIAETKILGGSVLGREVLNRLLQRSTRETAEPELLILNFSEVIIATASFLRESVMAFRDIVRSRRSSNFYPVVANINEEIRDEFLELMDTRGGALIICSLNDGVAKDFKVLGKLDPKQQFTFELVQRYKETDATELMQKHGKAEGLQYTTAWNNRLSSLTALGLLIETSQGRTKRYKTLGGLYGS